MPRAIIGYSELVIKVKDGGHFKCVPESSNLVLLNPNSIPKAINLKVKINYEFQKFTDYFLDCLIKKIENITLIAVDQTNLAHIFTFNNPYIVFIKDNHFNFNYQSVELKPVGAAKPVSRFPKVESKPIRINPLAPIPVLDLTGLPERAEKQTKKKPQTEPKFVKGEYLYNSLDGLDIFSPSKLALQVIWSDTPIKQIEEQLANRDESYYTRFINQLDYEYKNLKRKNKRLKLKNNIAKFFRINWNLLTQPIGK